MAGPDAAVKGPKNRRPLAPELYGVSIGVLRSMTHVEEFAYVGKGRGFACGRGDRSGLHPKGTRRGSKSCDGKGRGRATDSAQADLYRMLIRDLSTGGVIRQARESDGYGRFMKKRRLPRRMAASNTMEFAFEDSKPYVLMELGSQFVPLHYDRAGRPLESGRAGREEVRIAGCSCTPLRKGPECLPPRSQPFA